MKYNINNTIEDLISICKEKNAFLDAQTLRTAYGFVEDALKDTFPDLIAHSVRVASLTAEWGCGSDIVIAALIHHTLEENAVSNDTVASAFGEKVAKIAGSVADMSDRYLMKNRTGIPIAVSYDDFPGEMLTRNALYVKIADRMDNLKFASEDDAINPVLLAGYTRRNFISEIVRRVNANRFVDILTDLCVRVENPGICKMVEDKYSRITAENSHSLVKTHEILRTVFDPGIEFDDKELDYFRQFIVGFEIKSRSVNSIYRQLNSNVSNINRDLESAFCKEKIPLEKLVLIVSDKLSESTSKLKPYDVFFEIYNRYLSRMGFSIVGRGGTVLYNSEYLIISDETDNLFRLFIRTSRENLRYLYGDIIYEKDFQFRNEKPEIQLPEPRDKKIKVFREDGSAMLISSAATVLDFAFFQDINTGLHFDYALVNESSTRIGKNVRLNEGDRITVITDKNITPDITWFDCTRTAMATHYLVEYFSERNNLKKLL